MTEKFLAGDNPAALPGQAEAPLSAVGGDMQKTVYDINDDGKVNSAEHADEAGHATDADTADDLNGAASAGVSHYYGTDASGAVGFWPVPAGGGGGGGEANTTSNAGTGEGLAKPKVGVNLPFKTLKAGANITLTPSADEVEITASGGGAGLVDGDYGDITVSGGGTIMNLDAGVVGDNELAADAVTTAKILDANVTAAKLVANAVTTVKVLDANITNAKLANMANATIKGRNAAGAGVPEDLTATQVTELLNVFTSVLKGLVPASAGGTTNFLRADGAWAAPAGGGGGGGGVPTAAALCLFSANATGQTFTFVGSVDRQLTLSTEVYDPANSYDTSTGRYTPNVAGYYRVWGQAAAPSGSSQIFPQIYKNGVNLTYGETIGFSSTNQRLGVSTVVFMNGTTDYLELWAASSTSATTTTANAPYTTFHGNLIAT